MAKIRNYWGMESERTFSTFQLFEATVGTRAHLIFDVNEWNTRLTLGTTEEIGRCKYLRIEATFIEVSWSIRFIRTTENG